MTAQTSRGTVTGLVTDPTRAPVTSATVTLTNTATNLVRSTVSNEAGLYRFDAVDPGPYDVAVAFPGFRPARVSGITVQAAQVASIDLGLELGEQKSVVDVTAETVTLQTESPVRGGNLAPAEITQLPNASRNPAGLALTLPGVTTNRNAFGVATFAVDGSRGRSNNFLLDGTENNDISVAGQAFQVTNPDAVQETIVQTTNFDSEFGRAGGAVVNVVTKSGTNQLHGTASYLLDSTIDDSISSLQAQDPAVIKRGHPPSGTEQIWAGTLGGPIKKDRTFYFGSFQNDTQNSVGSQTVTAPSAAGWATLNSLFPPNSNKNVDLFRAGTSQLNATSQFFPVALGNGRPAVEFGTAAYGFSNAVLDRQWLIKLDHRIGNNDLLSGRFAYDDQDFPVASLSFPGFNTSGHNRFQNALISETHIFSPRWTNELRLPYNRITIAFPLDPTNSLGLTMPQIAIAGLNSFGSIDLGVSSGFPQGRIANNYGLQDTVTYTRGNHSIRFGFDLVDQRSRQFAPIDGRGLLSYSASSGFTGFANFVDDFGGSGLSTGSADRDFGSAAYYPKLFRQQYFAQDRWRVSSALTVSLGVRYEYFGTPLDSIRTPAYTGLFNIDPVTFTGPFSQPDKVSGDKNNFAPSIGIAYAPSFTGGIAGWLFGEHKAVIRTGYQIGYDSFFNNIASNAQTSSPNVVSTLLASTVTAAAPRGLGNLSAQIPTVARAVTPLDAQTLVVKNFVNPYYQKWSFGIQRELPGNFLLDVSYVGNKGTKLYLNEDLNPIVPASLQITPAGNIPANRLSGRLDNLQGSRQIRTNDGFSTYNAGQLELTRRFSRGFFGRLAYTHSKLIDNGSEVFASGGINVSSLSAIPEPLGGQPFERAVSLFDRPNRLSVTWGYELPFMKNQAGPAGHIVGGWQVSGIYTYESGVPYSVSNGFDADGIGGNGDRPLFNPAGQTNVRAIPSTSSPTGYINPDNNNAPIDAGQAEFIAVAANSGRTGNLGRNTERTPPLDNLNLNAFKNIRVTEGLKMEFRAEFYNALNHPQFGQLSVSPFAPSSAGTLGANVATTAPGHFLNPTFLDGGQRVIRYQLKFIF